VKNAPALLVDLRGNEGGNDVGNEILKRLVASDLKISSYRRLVRYRQTPAELNPFLDTWDPSFKNWGEAAVELPRAWPTAPPVHYFALTKFDDDSGGDVIHPEGEPFHGKVYVLMNAGNSSATFQFAQIVQQNKLGTLVGRPSGGNQRGINGGAFFFLRLPKSQIEMDLPLVGAFPASPQSDAGLTPDVLVAPTLQDIIEGKDPEMAKVAALQGK
jgi:C-terminal processing protease CtpA/Prc